MVQKETGKPQGHPYDFNEWKTGVKNNSALRK